MTDKRMSDEQLKSFWGEIVEFAEDDPIFPMFAATKIYMAAERAHEAEERLEVELDSEREEHERLKQWEQTIIYAPGEAREIALQRFRESDFARDIVAHWKKVNTTLKEENRECLEFEERLIAENKQLKNQIDELKRDR